MDQRGDDLAGQEDAWWRELYGRSASDTGPVTGGDSLDERFTSAAAVVRAEPPRPRAPEPPVVPTAASSPSAPPKLARRVPRQSTGWGVLRDSLPVPYPPPPPPPLLTGRVELPPPRGSERLVRTRRSRPEEQSARPPSSPPAPEAGGGATAEEADKPAKADSGRGAVANAPKNTGSRPAKPAKPMRTPAGKAARPARAARPAKTPEVGELVDPVGPIAPPEPARSEPSRPEPPKPEPSKSGTATPRPSRREPSTPRPSAVEPSTVDKPTEPVDPAELLGPAEPVELLEPPAPPAPPASPDPVASAEPPAPPEPAEALGPVVTPELFDAPEVSPVPGMPLVPATPAAPAAPPSSEVAVVTASVVAPAVSEATARHDVIEVSEVPPPPVRRRGPRSYTADFIGQGPPTYEAEPTSWPGADPGSLDDLVPDTVLDGARYGAMTLRAVSLRGDSARYRGEPRRDALLSARFGTGDDALLLVAMASGARAAEGAHRAARDICTWIAGSVGRSHARLSEDLHNGRRSELKSGLHRLTDRSYGRLRARAAELGLPAAEYSASLRCLLLPGDPRCRTRVFFGVGTGGLFRLRSGAWQDLDPDPSPPEPLAAEPSVPYGPGDRITIDLGIATPGTAHVIDPAEVPGEPFRFRASISRPGDALLVCTTGLAEPLRGEPELGIRLAERWACEEPPGLAAYLADTQLRVKGYADDRTACTVWEA
ncbi:protein phosphatase 2C domain-containing protein [Streptomyces sp. ET3-23]|uniref:protein phosphatase 2C domain-containing protein n=1 Tax=Streptomyces sp. ET3-23 TaxID=2885643 RepID=UPI001D111CFE|nr:protein phosphatase 2C domain-containing protein [Streptomyces sp. ET3-23]MCC2276787.1 protein phosphatase 2C domain-containing protein [Streptomyces sp. ET3-23]